MGKIPWAGYFNVAGASASTGLFPHSPSLFVGVNEILGILKIENQLLPKILNILQTNAHFLLGLHKRSISIRLNMATSYGYSLNNPP